MLLATNNFNKSFNSELSNTDKPKVAVTAPTLAVIVTSPLATAVTLPVASTVSTSVFEDS